jgi:hypothetical protein
LTHPHQANGSLRDEYQNTVDYIHETLVKMEEVDSSIDVIRKVEEEK